MEYFGLKRDFSHVGYFETEQQAQLFKELKFLLRQGRLVALSGVVGCGKTTTLERLQSELATEKDILLSRSLAIDKERVRLATLMTALFYDLATEKEGRLPTAPEQRERKLLSVDRKVLRSPEQIGSFLAFKPRKLYSKIQFSLVQQRSIT
jgi:type II secretory pathway predicted ATPase ExeA